MKVKVWFTGAGRSEAARGSMGETPQQAARIDDACAAERHRADSLFPLVYEELRAYAHRLFQRQQAPSRTLQPTAIVHEVFLRLASGSAPADAQQRKLWAGRTHFFATAARAMRMVLLDHVRRQRAAKRGGEGGWERVTLELADSGTSENIVDVLALDEALERLEALDPRQAKIVELRLFGGLTMEEVADAVGMSKRAVELDWRMARAWLEAELRDGH